MFRQVAKSFFLISLLLAVSACEPPESEDKSDASLTASQLTATAEARATLAPSPTTSSVTPQEPTETPTAPLATPADATGTATPTAAPTETPSPAATPSPTPAPQLAPNTFGIGSTKDGVRALMGTPDSINAYPDLYDIWEYSVPDELGGDSIEFDPDTGLVSSWYNPYGTLPVSLRISNRNSTATEFGIGSLRSDVFAAMGKPTSVISYGTAEVWEYLAPDAEYFFETDSAEFDEFSRVVKWSNRGGALRTVLGELSADTGAAFIDIGVSMADVLRLQGPPTAVDASYISFTHSINWSWNPPDDDTFSGSAVGFSAATKLVTGWDNQGDLKLSP